MEIKNLDVVECPYCTLCTLEPVDRVVLLAYDGSDADPELDSDNWVACRCSTCYNVVVLDREEVERS
jgi:hypothetical protein